MVQQQNKNDQPQDFIRLQDLLYMCLARWRWFVLSLVVCVGVAVAYLLITPSVYTRSASIRVKDDSKGKSVSSDIESFSDFGIFTSSTNVIDEIETLKTPDLMLEVVQRLHLDIGYTVDGRFHKEVLYGETLPVNATLGGLTAGETAAFDMKVNEDGTVTLSDFIRNDESVGDAPVSGNIGSVINSPLGRITVKRTTAKKAVTDMTIHVEKNMLHAAVDDYFKRLTATQNNEKSNVITISYNDVSVQRAEDVLNTLISVYNESWVKDKNQIAVSTSQFINERLGVIEGELGHVDNDISSYKSANLVPDVQAAASMYMTQASEASAAVNALNNQAYMARYIRNYLTSETNKFQLLPANSGIDNPTIAAQITEYNNKLLDRNGLVSQSSTQNPLVVEMDKSLTGLRSALVRSIDNQLVSLNEQIRSQQGRGGAATSKIASNPKQSKYLLSVERQQKVKESLYLFLLQKREENELSQAFTAYNTRIISVPGGSMKPTFPVKRNILLVAVALGLLIPVVIIFVRENMNTTVRGRKDLDSLTVPFIGEIPLYFHRRKRRFGFLGGKNTEKETQPVVVKEGSRNVINEAFRVVRTNLEFMLGKEKGAAVIMLTSANSGSGKTFITYNLAKSLAIKGKKVIALDLDLRKGSLSEYVDSPKRGVSDYLAGQVDDADSIIVRDGDGSSPDVIPIGTMPPNPTELLFSDGLKELLDKLRTEYEYIFLDCPPAEIVADADIISKQAGMTLFIIRAGLLDRSDLPDIEKYYTDQKYGNMSVLLNATDGGGRYGYKYGYKYGYHYGRYGSYGKKSDEQD